MSVKYTYQNYTITLDFRSDFACSITASDIFSGDFFINEAVELTKIRKDTVIATLTRKNQQHLKCKFNVVDVQPKKLIIAFEVSFDFLPTFTEYVSLDQIQNKGKGLNKVETAELKSDIEELEKMLNNISNKESFTLNETSHTFSGKGVLLQKEVERGAYLLEITGHYTCTVGSKHDLVIALKSESQSFEIPLCVYTNSSYGYPFSIRKDVILRQKERVVITMENKQGQSYSLQTVMTTFTPMVKVL